MADPIFILICAVYQLYIKLFNLLCLLGFFLLSVLCIKFMPD